MKPFKKSLDPIVDLYKKEDHPVFDREPHFIMSAENPEYPVKNSMRHSDVMDMLSEKGYNAEVVHHKGERGILVHKPDKEAVRFLMKLAHELGQDSVIYSDGYHHERHFVNGDAAGKHSKGQGTSQGKHIEGEDKVSMEDGREFMHSIEEDNLHDFNQSRLHTHAPIEKNEGEDQEMPKKIESKHMLDGAHPQTKLIHYSMNGGLDSLNPNFYDGRKVYYFVEGTRPHPFFTQDAKVKYVSRLANLKLYDIGKDPEGITQKVEQADPNYKIEDIDKAIKKHGYDGVYNSTAGEKSIVVAIYKKIKPEKELQMHRKDRKSASAECHHMDDANRTKAKEWAHENGHHNGDFLHELVKELNK